MKRSNLHIFEGRLDDRHCVGVAGGLWRHVRSRDQPTSTSIDRSPTSAGDVSDARIL